MKILYLLVVGLLCFDVNAGNWIPESQMGQDGATIYRGSKGKCETRSGEPLCFSAKDYDPRRHLVKNIPEDDLAKPIYRSPELSPDLADCTGSIGCMGVGLVCSEQGVVVRWDLKDNWPNIPGATSLNPADPWFLWCEKVVGFDQKLVRKWVLDSVMVAVADGEDSARDVKKTQLSTAKTRLRELLQNWPNWTQAEEKEILKHLVRRHLRE